MQGKTIEKDVGKGISKASIARLPLYLHFLQEHAKGAEYVSSTQLAQSISVSSVLVRKDLEYVSSESGKPRLGFSVSRLIFDIEKFLGYHNHSDVIVVGAGGLGRTFMGYEGFKHNGLNIVAAFDVDERLIGTKVAGKPIYAMEKMQEFIKENGVKIGIVTVPKHAAQDAVNLLVEAGIKAVWNFAPATLRVPDGVELKSEDLAAKLAILAGKLYNAER
ncbi:MAG: redox-sensing transcriptional repressor Rex [Clostridia bacterium]|nr:redox-sensing transcriptional repressor Rex [Clostridia bacterium]